MTSCERSVTMLKSQLYKRRANLLIVEEDDIILNNPIIAQFVLAQNPKASEQ